MYTHTIVTKQGPLAIFLDDEDAEVVQARVWGVHFFKNKIISVKRTCYVNAEYGPMIKSSMFLHQIVMARARITVAKGLVIDHKNGNPLDNRRENLRVCTKQQNFQNQQKRTQKSDLPRCDHPGVAWHRVAKKWRASISVKSKKVSLGTFSTMEEAIVARKSAECEHYGEFAFSNRLLTSTN